MSEQKIYNNCQSCGMSLRPNVEYRGTEANGNYSAKYCRYCYQKGKFTYPNFTAEQMKEFCVNKLVENKMPRWVAKMMMRNIHKLERWKK